MGQQRRQFSPEFEADAVAPQIAAGFIARQLLHDRSAQVRAELAGLGVSVAGHELLLIVSLEPRGVVL